MGEIWHEGRKLLDRSLRPGATKSYRQMIQDNTLGFLERLLVTPKEFRHHIELSVVILPSSCAVSPLIVMQPSGKACHVSHVWL